MANIEARITTPAAPEYLATEIAGRARPMKLPLSAFSEAELKAVGAEYTEALLAKAREQATTVATATKAPRKPKPDQPAA